MPTKNEMTLRKNHRRYMNQWMIFIPLVLPAVYLFFMPFQQAWLDIFLFFVLAFCYRQSMIYTKHREMHIFIQLVVVFIYCAIHTPWHLCFGFYPALGMSLLPSYRRITWMVATMMISIVVAIYVSAYLSADPLRFEWVPIAFALIAVPYVSRMYQVSCEIQRKLEDANADLIKSEERQRIARDLHDTLGQTLSLITLRSELVERLIPSSPDQAIDEAINVQRISRAALLQIRELVSDLQSIDITEELQRAEQIFHSAGIKFERQEYIDTKRVAPIISNILGMCLRECVTNVVKHSGAKKCSIRLFEEHGQYLLHVCDDGIGMAKEGGWPRNLGAGLLGMKERLLLIEGKLELASDHTNRTKVMIAIPHYLVEGEE